MLGNQRAHCYNISVMCVSEKSLCQKIDELWFLSWGLLSWMSQFLVCLSVWLWLPSPNLRPMLSAELKTCPDPVSRRWDWARLSDILCETLYLTILSIFWYCPHFRVETYLLFLHYWQTKVQMHYVLGSGIFLLKDNQECSQGIMLIAVTPLASRPGWPSW